MNNGKIKNIRIQTPIILATFVLLIVCTSIVTAIPTEQNNVAPVVQPPTGFTAEQVEQAKDLAIAAEINASKNLRSSGKTVDPLSAYQGGSYLLYAVISNIEDQYIAYNTQGGYLQIPIKTEIWSNTFQAGSLGYASYDLYYWNSYYNLWYRYTGVSGYTNEAGQVNLGFSIPHGYANRFLILGTDWYWTGYQWAKQGYAKFFRVSWL